MYSVNNIKDNNNSSVLMLKDLYDKSGNCSISGYLGDSIESINYNDNLLEFTSKKIIEENEIKTKGCVLSDSIIISQIQTSSTSKVYLLYSWDYNFDVFTYIIFDNVKSLISAYERIKKNDSNLCNGDVSKKLIEIGVSFDNISQIFLNKKLDDIDNNFDDYSNVHRVR